MLSTLLSGKKTKALILAILLFGASPAVADHNGVDSDCDIGEYMKTEIGAKYISTHWGEDLPKWQKAHPDHEGVKSAVIMRIFYLVNDGIFTLAFADEGCHNTLVVLTPMEYSMFRALFIDGTHIEGEPKTNGDKQAHVE